MSERDDIVLDMTVRIIVDDVSDGSRSEFRASTYDCDNELISEAWAKTISEVLALVEVA